MNSDVDLSCGISKIQGENIFETYKTKREVDKLGSSPVETTPIITDDAHPFHRMLNAHQKCERTMWRVPHRLVTRRILRQRDRCSQ